MRAAGRALQLLGAAAGLAAAALLLVPLLAFWHALPDVEGTWRAAGIDAPLRIVRDAHGIPHVFAGSDRDAYFGLGFAHAQDRFTQMDLARRAGRGRLAEGFGAGAVEADALFRTLRLDRAAEEALAAADPASRSLLEAYAAGVNAALDTGLRPWEHRLAGLPAERWAPADSVLAIKMMSLLLAGNARKEALRARLAPRLGEERLRELWPAAPADAPGSNAWAVGGGRTASGRPMLANDPHLGLSAPPVWYLAHLSAPGIEAWGATIPGIAGIVTGRTERVAWGLTNTYADVQDLFRETLAPGDPDSYLAPGGPRPFETRTETIRVRGGGPVEIRVRETRHGPVVSDHIPAFATDDEGTVLALRWPVLRGPDPTFRAAFGITGARDAASFRRALGDFADPSQTVVYADAGGAVGYAFSGRLPARARGDGFLPRDGRDAGDDWTGILAGPDLPAWEAPPGGQVVSANQRLLPPGYPHLVAREFPPRFRAARIRELLADAPAGGLTAADFARIQPDTVSRAARALAPLLLAAGPFEGASAEAAGLLAGWDGAMDRDRPEPLIYSAWHRAASRRILDSALGEEAPEGFSGPRPQLLAALLAGETAGCGDGPVACREIVRESLAEALAWAAGRHGGDMAGWRWGDEQRASHLHALVGRLPLAGALLGVSRPHGGGPHTVMQMRADWRDEAAPFASGHGPGVRLVHDLGEPARSHVVLATGQAGNPLSRWYRDQADAWFAGELLALEADPARIAAAATVTLVPEAGRRPGRR